MLSDPQYMNVQEVGKCSAALPPLSITVRMTGHIFSIRYILGCSFHFDIRFHIIVNSWHVKAKLMLV